MAEMSLLDQEHFRVVVLNTKNQVMATPEVYKGSVNATSIRSAEVFREAVAPELSGHHRGAQPPLRRPGP